MPAPCNAKHISLGPAPWNEIRPKKYFSPGIPVAPLWQNSWNVRYAIPLGIYCNKNSFPKAPLNQFWWSFFTSILVNDTCW